MRALVTGAGRGIGRAIAGALQAAGAHVHICDVDEARLAAARADGLAATRADVADPDDVAALFREVGREMGGLDVLVNNAGTAGPTAPVEEVEPQAWVRTVAVNLTGAFLCARQAVPLLRGAGGGSIVNIVSSAGVMGYPLRSPYAAAKWGVVGLTKTLAMELGPDDIRVNAVCPGPVEGERMEAVIAAEAAATGRTAGDVRAGYLAQTSLRTFVTPEDIAATVAFLCSPAATKITGQVLSVDGHTETLRT